MLRSLVGSEMCIRDSSKLSEPVLPHLVNAYCKPYLLYGADVICWNKSELSALPCCFNTALCKIYEANLKTLDGIFTARAYARAVLGVVILFVCPSVRLSHAWIATKLNDALQIFLYHMKGKGNHSATLVLTVVGGRRPLPSEICAQSDPPFEKR